MNALYARIERFRPFILSILRIVVGLLYLQHGLSKVFNFPAPSPVPSLHGLLILAAFLETVGAALFLVGAYTRIVAFILSGEMAFAYFMAHAPRSFYPARQRRRTRGPVLLHLPLFRFCRRRPVERRPRGAEPGLSLPPPIALFDKAGQALHLVRPKARVLMADPKARGIRAADIKARKHERQRSSVA